MDDIEPEMHSDCKIEAGSNSTQIHVFTCLGACEGHIFAQIFVNVEVM